MVSQAKFSRIYTANDLASQTKIDINLSRLPRRDSNLPKVLCLVGLALIVTIASFTIYYSRKIKANKVSTNETRLE